jgi:transcriptional regulator with XRE-family HTH domain
MACVAEQVNLFDGGFGVTSGQCRGARGLLNWSQLDLVEHSGVGHKTIADFERGVTTRPYGRTLTAIIAAFEAAGIEFINRGVRMRASSGKSNPPHK